MKMSCKGGEGRSLLEGVSKAQKLGFLGVENSIMRTSSTSQNVTRPISSVTGPIFYVEEIIGII